MSTEGIVFEIKRFAVHDGPGIRTTLFLKGCPLRCLWCHNPESISPHPQLAYYAHKCINCGECVSVCPEHAHAISLEKLHYFERRKCRSCGKCETACLGNALQLYGMRMTVQETLNAALEDRDFFGDDGGVTLSGGEPLLQADFCFEILTALKRQAIHTALDTCGQVKWKTMSMILNCTDIFLFDFKAANPQKHHKLTGSDNRQILENLQKLSDAGAEIEIRMPLIPALNDSDEDIHEAGKILSNLHIKSIKILPYHNMARSKYDALGMANKIPASSSQDNVNSLHAVEILRNYGLEIN